MKNPEIKTNFQSKTYLVMRFKNIEITVNPLQENFGLKGFIAAEKHYDDEEEKYVYPALPKLFPNLTMIFNSIEAAKNHITKLIMLSQAQYNLSGIFYKIQDGIVYKFDEKWKESNLKLHKFRACLQNSKNCIVKPMYNKLFKAA